MFRDVGIQSIGYDVDPAKTECDAITAVHKSDAAIFMVQTPSFDSGAFDHSYLIAAALKIATQVHNLQRKDYLYIVSSTVMPGTCDELRKALGDNLCYKPEFIRLEHVHADLRLPDYILIGSESNAAASRCADIYRRISNAPIKCKSLVEAELAKITLNCALTMKISLANQLHLVAQKMGADSHKIMDLVGSDPRIGHSYLRPGAPYGSPCLPRDNKMFQYVAARVGVDAVLSEAADKINCEISRVAVDSLRG
jgi:UDPglucose 6-dehydrogenase